MEGLGEITLQPSCPVHDTAIGLRQCLQPQHGDDVLQLPVTGELLAHPLCDLIVTVADQGPVHHLAGRGEGVDRRVDALGGLVAREDHGGVQVGEERLDRRVGHVVRGDIDRLHCGDVAVAGGQDTLLQFGDLGQQGGLVADGGRHASQQPRDLAAGLDEAEGVVHQEQDVLGHGIAQVFRVGQGRQTDAEAYPGRFVHLTEHHQGA